MYVISALWRLSWEYPKFKARLASEEEPPPKNRTEHMSLIVQRDCPLQGLLMEIGSRQLKQILSYGTETGPLFVVNVCCEVLLYVA